MELLNILVLGVLSKAAGIILQSFIEGRHCYEISATGLVVCRTVGLDTHPVGYHAN